MSRPWQLRPLDREAVAGLQEAIAEERADQLEQEAAWNGEEWDDARHDAVYAAQFKEAALLAGLLAARGFTQPEEALSFLAGEDSLSDPYLLTDMDKAVARIRQAIASGETIVIYGDYDVDGVTATSLLYEQLKGLGGSVKCMLPSREGDGYGLSRRAIDRIHAKGYTLIVTVDNGISAVEEAAYAASLGIDLVVTDHHLPPSVLPAAVAVVDPKREGMRAHSRSCAARGWPSSSAPPSRTACPRSCWNFAATWPPSARWPTSCPSPGRTAPSSRRGCRRCIAPSGPALRPCCRKPGWPAAR